MVWSKKRKRYVFRKRSRWDRILWLGLGSLVVVGLIWSIPWLMLPLVDREDTPKVQTSQDQPEQADSEGVTENRAEQGSTGGDSKDEKTPEAAPSNEEVGSNDLSVSSSSSSSSSSFAQTSPPPQAPSALPSEAAPGAQEVRMTSLSPNDYWYTEPDYQYFVPSYWDYGWDYYDGDNYYWEY